jgi:Domain of unknown function (DUF5671)
MPANPKISEFIERAKTAGGSDQSIVAILTAHGWPEKEVYESLAAHYEHLTGVAVPRRETSTTAAKDAFFYLLVFSTLATWTIGLGSLAFSLIDRWLADVLFQSNYYGGYDTYNVASAMASVLIAFPIYLLVSRSVVRDVRRHPEKLNSSVRKWLTYMALVIAAGVFIGDLINALTFLLRGEITSRFLAKSFVVLVLSGGVFFYYFGGLKKSEETAAPGRMSRDAWMAALTTAIVAAMIVLGFVQVGTPGTQRMMRADEKRIQDLFQISTQIHLRFHGAGKLPAHLDELSNIAFVDPVTRVAYPYQPKEGGNYELCATFSLDSRQVKAGSRSKFWSHPAGNHCFELNAAGSPENPNIFLPD